MQQIKTFFPFGPPVYISEVEPKYIDEMMNAMDKVYGIEEENMLDRLAGRLDHQYRISSHVSESCKGHIMQHACEFGNDCGLQLQNAFIDELWVNIQRYMEVNPFHKHTGMFSFVIYLHNELNREETINNKFDNAKQSDYAGHLELKYGEENFFNWVDYKVWPEKGMIVMFPSWLTHMVYPHYEKDKKRISVAGNIQQSI